MERCRKILFLFALLGSSFYLTGCGSDSSAGGRSYPVTSVLASSNDQIVVGVRYVAFRDSGGTAVTNEGAVRKMLAGMSSVWSQCHISFSLDSFEVMDPNAIDANYSPANYYELDEMRMNMQSNRNLLMVGTGTWNRSGDLGNSGSNCYSSFPGDDAQGIVCEKSSAAGTMIMAHEVGHYFNLIHTDNPDYDGVDDTFWNNVGSNLMNHVVASTNDELTSGQCVRARTAIGDWRRGTLR